MKKLAALIAFLALTGIAAAQFFPGVSTCAVHQWFNGTAANGIGTCTQPAIADLSSSGTTRSGDIPYWNGSTWVTLPGNNSGSNFLLENASGVPSWNSAPVNNSLGADVALNNTANYFDGPSVAQGTTGTWFASGTVTLVSAPNTDQIFCKLWDGTTVIASSAAIVFSTANNWVSASLSGYLASPAGNIRISCKDISNTAALIKFNASGNSKDSTLSAIRVQ